MAIFQPVSFGVLLRRYRIERGLTQEKLAERARISANAIAALESGARKVPRRATLEALAQGLALTAQERTQLEAAAHPVLISAYAESRIENQATQPTPFVGRGVELQRIGRFLQPDSEKELVCAVAGEPGIGKSRLLYETIFRARASGWTVLEGGCYRQDGETPSSPWPRVLMRFLAQRSPAQQRLDLQGCSWLTRLLPELADSGLTPLPTWNLAGEQERRLIYAAVGRFLSNVAGPAGTLLALDDLQWAGADALALLTSLARERNLRPLKMLLAYRDTDVTPDGALAMALADLTREGSVGHIQLRPLETVEAREILGQLLPESAGDSLWNALSDDLLRHADGVPFFLVSCAADLRSRSLARTENGWKPPQDVAGSVRQRLITLSPDAQGLLKIAAIAGRVASGLLLLAAGATIGMDEARALTALDEGCRSGLLVELDGEQYAFAHDLLHEVIAADLSTARRRALHRRVADALEQLAPATRTRMASELAWRLEAAGEAARALPYTLQAAAEAESANAPAEAERLYRCAVELAQTVADEMAEARACERLGVLLYAGRRFAEAAEAFTRAIEIYRQCDAPNEVATTTQRLSRTYNNAGMIDAGVEALRSAILFLTPNEDIVLERGIEGLASARMERALASLAPAAAARLGLSISVHLLNLGRPQRAFEIIEQAERYARLAGDNYTKAHAHSFRGDMLAGLGRFAEALETWQEAVEMTRRAGNFDMLVSTLLTLAHARIARGELDDAERYVREAREIMLTQVGDLTFLIDCLLLLGEIAFIRGDWHQAREHFEQVKATTGDSGRIALDREATPLARLDIAEGQIETGLRAIHQEGADNGEERLSHAARLPYQEHLATTLTLAEYDLFTGDLDTAVRRLIRAHGAPAAQFSSLPGLLAQAYILQGHLDEAEALLDQALSHLRAAGLRPGLIAVLDTQALLASRLHNWAAADQVLEKALDLARTIPAPYAEVKLLARSGEIALARKRPAEARRAFEQALAICERLGEGLYRPHIERALVTLKD